MNESQYGSQSVSIVVNLYLGILKGIPELFHAFTDHRTMNYYQEAVEQEILQTENAVTIAADDPSIECLKIKLQEKGIGFIMIASDHEAVKETIKSNGRYLFLCRESDHDYILEVVNEIRMNLADMGQEPEAEEERERVREEENGENGGIIEPGGTEGDLKEERPEEEEKRSRARAGAKQDGKDHSKRKRKQSAGSPVPLPDWQNDKGSAEMPADSGTAVESTSCRNHFDNKTTAQATGRNGQAEYSTNSRHEAYREGLASADRNKKTDFHDRTRAEGESRQETVKRSDIVSAILTQRPEGRGSNGETDILPENGLSNIRDASVQEIKRVSFSQVMVLGNSSSLPDSESDPISQRDQTHQRSWNMTTERGISISASRMLREPAKSAQEHTVEKVSFPDMGTHTRTAGRYQETCIYHQTRFSQSSAREYGSVSELKKQLGVTANPISGHVRGAAKKKRSSCIQMSERHSVSGKNSYQTGTSPPSDQAPPVNGASAGGSSKIRITRIPMSSLPDGIQMRLENEAYSEHGKTLPAFHTAERLSYKTPGDILRTRRLYQTRDVLSPRNFQKLFRQGRRLVVQSVLSQGPEGGKVAAEWYDRTSPVVTCMAEKFMAAGAIQLTRSASCSRENLTAAFAAKKNISYEEAQEKLLLLFQNQPQNDNAVLSQLREAYSLQTAEGILHLLSGMGTEDYLNFIDMADISAGLKEKLAGIPQRDLDILMISRLLKGYSSEKDQAFLNLMQAGYMRRVYRGASFEVLFRRYLRQSLKCIGQHSDAGLALAQITGGARYVYGAYKAGVRLLYTLAGTFRFHAQSSAAAQFMLDPVKGLGRKAEKTAGRMARRTTAKLVSKNIIRQKTVQHASSALKLLANPLKPITARIMNTVVMRSLQKAVGKLAPALAKAGAVLGWAAVIVLILVLLLETVQANIKTEAEKGSVNWNFAQDTEIIQEIVTELTLKNEAFIADINDAAYHRGAYHTITGLTADENVTFYEAGAYNVVFRDIYGNELEPTHVDLNNTKAIVSMASKFMPYPFRKLPENASDKEKKVYEELKQHFKDYCNFLWASTHQITIEEYHPGNSDGIDGAMDNSGLVTTLDQGKCEKDGEKLWLPLGFVPDQVRETLCDTCVSAEGTGLGDYLDDLCTHGKDGNQHGGWRKTGTKRVGVNCKAAGNGRQHHDFCDHRDGDCDPFTCDLSYYKKSCWHWEYEWVYECGGHMGLVVYVTIGDLSRLPGFAEAGDVDYGSVGNYDAEEGEEGTANAEDS